MQQANRSGAAVGEPDRAAIGDVDAEDFPRLGGDQAIDAGNDWQAIPRKDGFRSGDQGHTLAVDLLGAPPVIGAEITTHQRLVDRSQPGQGFITVRGGFDAIDTTDPARPETGQAIDRI